MPASAEIADPFIGKRLARAEAGGFSFGHWVSPADADPIEEHGHDDAHLIVITAGTFVTEASGRDDRGPLIVFNPSGTYHADHFAQGGAFFSVNISRTVSELAAEFALPSAPSAVRGASAFVAALRLMRHALTPTADGALHAEAQCLDLLGHAGQRRASERRPPRWLRRACDLLRDSDGRLSVADVAREVAVHPIHLTRTFQTFHNCSPGEFMRAYRVQAAAAMLTRTKRPASEIAQACGFADQSHFTRSFKLVHGVAPEGFRRLVG